MKILNFIRDFIIMVFIGAPVKGRRDKKTILKEIKFLDKEIKKRDKNFIQLNKSIENLDKCRFDIELKTILIDSKKNISAEEMRILTQFQELNDNLSKLQKAAIEYKENLFPDKV